MAPAIRRDIKIATLFLGATVGFMVGGSASSVVAVALPLVFGLLAPLTAALTKRLAGEEPQQGQEAKPSAAAMQRTAREPLEVTNNQPENTEKAPSSKRTTIPMPEPPTERAIPVTVIPPPPRRWLDEPTRAALALGADALTYFCLGFLPLVVTGGLLRVRGYYGERYAGEPWVRNTECTPPPAELMKFISTSQDLALLGYDDQDIEEIYRRVYQPQWARSRLCLPGLVDWSDLLDTGCFPTPGLFELHAAEMNAIQSLGLPATARDRVFDRIKATFHEQCTAKKEKGGCPDSGPCPIGLDDANAAASGSVDAGDDRKDAGVAAVSRAAVSAAPSPTPASTVSSPLSPRQMSSVMAPMLPEPRIPPPFDGLFGGSTQSRDRDAGSSD